MLVNMYNFQYQKTDPRSKDLLITKPGSATMDLHALLEPDLDLIVIEVGDRVKVQTGISIQIPLGYEGQIRSCHKLSDRDGICVLNAPATVSRSCTHELFVLLINLSQEPQIIAAGQKIAVLAITPVLSVIPIEMSLSQLEIPPSFPKFGQSGGVVGNIGISGCPSGVTVSYAA
jgi:dUTPase